MNDFDLAKISKHPPFSFHVEIGQVNGNFPLHTHKFCEIFFVLSGKGIHQAGETEYPLQTGSLFAVKGREQHGFLNCQDLRLYNIMFQVDDLELEDCRTLPGFWVLFLHEQSLGSISHLELEGEENKQVTFWCETMLREYDEAKSGYKAVCRSVLIQMAVFLSRRCQSLSDNQLQPDFRLARALVRMETDFSASLDVKTLAQIVGLSPRHFSRLFRQVYGESPLQRLLQIRIRWAQQLLAEGGTPVLEVAERCGFQDGNYFSRVFKEKTGFSPSAFQKQG